MSRPLLLLICLTSYMLAVRELPSFCLFATRCGDLGHPEGSRNLLLVLGAVMLISFVLLVASLAPRQAEPEAEVAA